MNQQVFGRRLAALGVAACLMGSAASAETIVIGYQQIVGPFIAAIADGSLDAAAKKAGVEIDWRQFSSGGDISTALASGNVPVGVIGSTGIAASATRGVDFQLFWILDNIGKSEALVARNGSGIEKPEDLVGKKVAVPFVSTSHFHLLVGMEELWKIDPAKVQILNMKPPQIMAAWQRGDIDAAYVWPPALTQLLADGKVVTDSEVIGAASVPTFDGLVVATDFAKEHPEFMTEFTKALAKAYADYNADKAAWTAESQPVKNIIRMIGGDPAGTAEALNMLSFPDAKAQVSETWLGGGATKALSESAAFLVEQKQIDKALPDYAPYVNASFAEAAAKAE